MPRRTNVVRRMRRGEPGLHGSRARISNGALGDHRATEHGYGARDRGSELVQPAAGLLGPGQVTLQSRLDGVALDGTGGTKVLEVVAGCGQPALGGDSGDDRPDENDDREDDQSENGPPDDAAPLRSLVVERPRPRRHAGKSTDYSVAIAASTSR